MPVFLIPFAIFFACCIAQFFFLNRVKRALFARHPDLLLTLLDKSFFGSNNAITMFVWRRRDLSLNDPELTESVKQFKLLMIVAYGAWGLCALAVLTGTAFLPLPLDWLPAGAASPPVHAQTEAVRAAPNLPAAGVIPAFGIVFAAALVGNLAYLVLAWRLSTRWNSVPLGETATLGDPLAVLGVIWWSKPAKHDDPFLRLRIATRTAFVLALAGMLTVFAFVFSVAL